MSTSPNLKLPYIDANQNQKSVTHNAALTILDALVNLQVQSNVLTAPPGTLVDGQCWIVASGGTGAWLGKDLDIAAWQDGAWNFYAPNKGFVAYVDSLAGAQMWTGTAWVSLLGAITQLSLNDLGIGTAVDPGNPLAAKLNSALFAAQPTGAGGTGDIRLTLSKQAAARTASLLFQDNYAGRAEIGLAGDDNFHVKVSPDGATFYDALDIAGANGAVSFLATPTHPSPASGDSSTASATTAWITAKAYVTAGAAAAAAPVQSVAGRTGAVTLGVADVSGAAALASPALGGTPTAPTPATADNSTKLATTAYVTTAVTAAFARTQVNNANYTVLASDRTVAVIALTAARILTLPAASSYPQGATLTLLDESGACSAANNLTIARAGTDTISGATSVVLSTAYAYLALESNGSNKWTLIDQSTSSLAQQAASSIAVTGGTIDGTAIGGTTPAVATLTTLKTTGSIGIGVSPASGDPSLGIQSTFPQNWRFSVSNSNGNFYWFDGTNTKFPITVEPNAPNNTFYVKASGNVGIGTSSPATSLDVAGPIRPGQYTVATLPAAGTAGRVAYASNARMFNGAGTLEGAGSGTGGLVIDNGTTWKIAGTNVTVSA